jgi:hypothetical protein
LRYYHYRGSFSDSYGYAKHTRFLPKGVQDYFEQRTTAPYEDHDVSHAGSDLGAGLTSQTVRRRIKSLWS